MTAPIPTHKLVPIEPTQAMIAAMVDGFIAVNGDNRAEFMRAWPRLLAAAPTIPEAPADDAAERVRWQDFAISEPARAAREPDWYLRAKVADLVHLLSYADIRTPSKGDAEQAKTISASLRTYLKQDAALPTPPAQAARSDAVAWHYRSPVMHGVTGDASSAQRMRELGCEVRALGVIEPASATRAKLAELALAYIAEDDAPKSSIRAILRLGRELAEAALAQPTPGTTGDTQ